MQTVGEGGKPRIVGVLTDGKVKAGRYNIDTNIARTTQVFNLEALRNKKNYEVIYGSLD